MARGDKDINHKADALRFCVASGAIPYLEVLVPSAVDLTADEKMLTDIDVLGLRLAPDGSVTRTLFDCKSSKIPPMSRAFWLSGLMSYVKAQEGFVILGRGAERAHRMSAKTINVRLFDQMGFQSYGAATSAEFPLLTSYAANIEAWHRFCEGANGTGRHANLFRYLTSEVPLASDPVKRFRRLVAVVREHRGELDPGKSLHMALFAESVLAAAVLLVPMIGELRNLVQLSEGRGEYESVLRYYLWGGRDGYTMLQRMNEVRGASSELAEFENTLLAWPQFVQLTRGLLDAPTSVQTCCLPLRELALRNLVDHDPESEHRLGRLFLAPRARQTANRVSAYLAAACKLPADFADNLADQIDGLIQRAEATVGS